MANNAQVWIVWSPGGDLDYIKALCYGDGSCRVYNRNHYDARVDLGRNEQDKPIPYFRHRHEVLAFLVANPGEQCQVDTRTNLFTD